MSNLHYKENISQHSGARCKISLLLILPHREKNIMNNIEPNNGSINYDGYKSVLALLKQILEG